MAERIAQLQEHLIFAVQLRRSRRSRSGSWPAGRARGLPRRPEDFEAIAELEAILEERR